MEKPRPPRELARTNVLLTILAVVATGFLVGALRDVLLPLFVAMFLSYLGMPVLRLGRLCRLPVPISVFLVIVILTVAIGAIGLVFYISGSEFVGRLSHYEHKLRPLVSETFRLAKWEDVLTAEKHAKSPSASPEAAASDPPGEAEIPVLTPPRRIDWEKVLRSTPVMGFATGLVGGVGTAVLTLLFLVFILMDRGYGSMDARIASALGETGSHRAQDVLQEIHQGIERYILIKTGISLFTGLVVTLSLTILDVPFALLFGVMTFFMNFIPNIGSILVSIPPVLVALVHFDSHWQAVPVALVLIGLQFVIGNLLEPIIFGRQLQLNPITVLLWLVIWGFLWGVWGMVLAVPLAAATRIILGHTGAGHPIATLMGGATTDVTKAT